MAAYTPKQVAILKRRRQPIDLLGIYARAPKTFIRRINSYAKASGMPLAALKARLALADFAREQIKADLQDTVVRGFGRRARAF